MPVLKSRLGHVGDISSGWSAMIMAAWTALTAADTLIEKWGSDGFRKSWEGMWLLPKVGWRGWLIGLLVITVLAIFEGSYRKSRKMAEALDKAQEQLEAKLPDIYGQVLLGYLDAGKLHDNTKWEEVPDGCTITLYIDAVNRNDQTAWFTAPPQLSIVIAGREHAGTWKHICSQLLSVNDPTIFGDKMIRDFFDQRWLDEGFSMVKARPARGWLMFYVESFDKNQAFGRAEVTCDLEVTVKDTLGGSHPIRAGLPLKVDLICLTKDLLPKQPIA